MIRRYPSFRKLVLVTLVALALPLTAHAKTYSWGNWTFGYQAPVVMAPGHFIGSYLLNFILQRYVTSPKPTCGACSPYTGSSPWQYRLEP